MTFAACIVKRRMYVRTNTVEMIESINSKNEISKNWFKHNDEFRSNDWFSFFTLKCSITWKIYIKMRNFINVHHWLHLRSNSRQNQIFDSTKKTSMIDFSFIRFVSSVQFAHRNYELKLFEKYFEKYMIFAKFCDFWKHIVDRRICRFVCSFWQHACSRMK